MSYLTQSESELWDAVVEALEGEGFDYNPLTTTRSEYLATALGEPTDYLRKPFAQLAAELNASFGGSLSHLTSAVAHLLDDLDANIGEGGGGEEPYVADAVHFDTGHLVRLDPFTASDATTGFISLFIKRDPLDYTYLFYQDDTTIISIGSNGFLRMELADEAYESFLYLDATGPVPETWSHILFAWDTGHEIGSRRHALYVNDIPDSLIVADDEGVSFSSGIASLTHALVFGGAAASKDGAEFGLWIGSSIVEADNTILLSNRRKFVDAAGKPANPTGWPASPVLKFVGDAASFATNQGSGGAFDVESGSLTDASTSPSD